MFKNKKSRFTKSILDLKLKLKNSKKESKMIENRDSSGMPILQANLSIIQVIKNHGWNQMFLDSKNLFFILFHPVDRNYLFYK